MSENETANYDAPKRTRHPIPGETPIGRVNVKKPNGLFDVYTVQYGNVVDPIMDNKPIFLGTAQYLKMMDAFYKSKAGAEYVIYSEDKLLEDYLHVRRVIEANCAKARQEAKEKAEAEAKAAAEAAAKAEAEAIAKQTQERKADEAYVMDNLYEKDARVRKIMDDKRAKEEKAKAAAQQKTLTDGPMQRQALTGEVAKKAAMQRAKMLTANGIPDIPDSTPAPAPEQEPKVMKEPPVPRAEEEPAEADAYDASNTQDDAYDDAPAEAETYEDEYADEDDGSAGEEAEGESADEEQPEEEPEPVANQRRGHRVKPKPAPKPTVKAKANTATATPTGSTYRDNLKPILVTMLIFEILIAVMLAAELCIDIFGVSYFSSLFGF